MRRRSGLIALIAIGIIAASVLLAPILAPYPSDAGSAGSLEIALQAPNSTHWFGTDELGRDVFTRVLFGGRTSLLIGLVSIASSVIVGTLMGLVSGYVGGWSDEFMMRFADVFLGVPSLILAMLVVIALGGGPSETALAISVTTWPHFARLVRGEAKRIKALEYVAAAESYGASRARILWRHLFPAAVPALVAQATLLFAQAILVTAALGFLGLGARPPSPEWGLSIAIGREYLPESWWVSFFPGLAIVLVVLALNYLGDALRESLDAAAVRRTGAL